MITKQEFANLYETCLPGYYRELLVRELLNPEKYERLETTSFQLASYLAMAMRYEPVATRKASCSSVKSYKFISPDGERVLDFKEDSNKLYEFEINLHSRIGRPSGEFRTVIGMMEADRYGGYPLCTGNSSYARTEENMRAVIDNLITFGNPSAMVEIINAPSEEK
jgi:hypothetical protein